MSFFLEHNIGVGGILYIREIKILSHVTQMFVMILKNFSSKGVRLNIFFLKKVRLYQHYFKYVTFYLKYITLAE